MAEAVVWKKPSDVMKIHRRRKSVSQKRITTDADKRTNVIYKSPSKSVKRKNPFHRDSPHPNPSKRLHIDFKENVSQGDPLSCKLFNILDSADQDDCDQKTEVSPPTSCSHIPSEDVFNLERTKQESSAEIVVGDKTDETKPSPWLPVDWALKTKLRVVSSRTLNWCVQLKSVDEAQGVKNFTENSSNVLNDLTEQKRLFHRSCLYWIHPNIPWMKLFPRIIDDSKSSLTISPLLQDDIQRNLQADWEQSFTSAYHQLRCGLCPYFYVCTHQLTVLFHSGKDTQSGIVAMVTPTTRGFRESLQNEGISFRLPVGDKGRGPDMKDSKSPDKPNKETAEGESCKVDEDEDDLLDTDDAAHGWLESMGLDKAQFPSLDPKKVKLQREGFRVIDHRPESLVLIEGADVQAFFNFLLNCRTCTAMSGTQAGLPPTILSPTSFKGATLKSHKVKHTAVKQADREGEVTHAHIVEVTGPILPSHYQQLISLFHHTQAADFGMVFNNSDPTVPFNILPSVLKPKCDSRSKSVSPNSSNNKIPVETDDDIRNSGCREDGGSVDFGDNNVKNKNASLSLDTIPKEESGKDLLKEPGCDDGRNCVLDVTQKFRNVPVSERVSAVKEIVCTVDGFVWNS